MFKKTFLLVVSLTLFFSFSTKIANAIENRGAFVITKFDVGIFVKKDASIEVEEVIDVNFSQKRHGIFRKIPVRYTDDNGFKYNMKIKDVSVVTGQGKSIQFSDFNESSNFVLKIGDPDLEIFGDVQYVIHYTVQKGMRFFDDHDEIYWNPIGVDWPTQIYNASSTIYLEEGISSPEKASVCFTGGFGSVESDCLITALSASEVRFNATKVLNHNEGMTVAVNLPKGVVDEPTQVDYILMFLQDNWAFAIPIIIFGFMFYLWYFKGKELDLKRTVIAQYGPPDKLTPGEMGYLIKEHYSHEFVAADIVNLAVKGYLEISEVELEGIEILKKIGKITGVVKFVFFTALIGFMMPFFMMMVSNGFDARMIIFLSFFVGVFLLILFSNKNKFFRKTGSEGKISDYELKNLKDWADAKDLTLHEKRLMKGLFASKILGKIKLSDKKKFYSHVEIASKKIKEQIGLKDYFEKSTHNSKILYVIIGVLSGFGMFMIASGTQRLDFAISAIATAAVFIGFGIAMSKKTHKGAEAYWHAKGYEHYIDIAEKYRVKFNEEENIFEKTLPYAMIFGNVDKWAKAFEGMIKESPTWYHSSSPISTFHPAAFASSLSNGFATAANSASASPSSSSSGGSSGGGGGGSW